MEQTIELKEGIYTGELKDGLPHGSGKLQLSDTRTFEGQWKEGKRHGTGHYSHIWRRDYDGLECVLVHHKCGIWTDDILSGVIWEYRFEEDINEKTTEQCVYQDEYGLVLLGINREGKMIGLLAEQMDKLAISYDRGMFSYRDKKSWGKLIRNGHTYIGQFSSYEDRPYYAEDYIPHGFCIEMDDENIIYAGMYDMGEYKGAGVFWSNDVNNRFKMVYKVL